MVTFRAGLRVSGFLCTCVFAASTSASAQTGVISACYHAKNGQLRVVPTGQSCLPSELPISWNIEGAQGVPGPQGPPGADGQPGETAGAGGFTVVDRDGTFVGFWNQTGRETLNQLSMLVPVGDEFVAVRANRLGFVPQNSLDDSTPARWTNAQCTGDFVLVRSTRAFAQAGVVVTESNVPVIYAPGAAIDPPVTMYERFFGSCSQYFPDLGEVAATPVRIVPSAVPPFTLVR